MKKINVFRKKSLKSVAFESLLLGSFAFSPLQASEFPLHNAEHRNQDEIRRLLGDKTDPNTTDDLGNTPLHYAETSEAIELLCAAGADVNMQNEHGNTSLHVVLHRFAEGSENDQECIKALLKHGANPNIANAQGDTPLLIAQKGIGGVQIIDDNDDFIDVADEAKERLKEVLKLLEEKVNPLHCAVANGNAKEVKKLLVNDKVNPNAVDGFGNTALHYARDQKIIGLLCAAGANVNALNECGDTPLYRAVIAFFFQPRIMLECISTLLEKGADPDINNALSKSPREVVAMAIKGTIICDGKSHFDITNDDVIYKDVRKLFNPFHEIGEDVNEDEIYKWVSSNHKPNLQGKRRNTLLHYVKTPKTIRQLCAAGANVNALNKYGDTPLHVAVYDAAINSEYDQERIKILLEHGANPNIENEQGDTPLSIVQKVIAEDQIVNGNDDSIEVTDGAKERLKKVLELLEKKVNPFHCAVANSNVEEMKELLINGGVNPNEVDGFGNIALHYARDLKIIIMLRDFGADVNAQNEYGDTPLHSAVFAVGCQPDFCTMEECIVALLGMGANPNIANKRNKTPLQMVDDAIRERKVDNGSGESFKVDDQVYAVYKGIEELFKQSPLHEAVQCNDKKMVKKLLDKGYDPNMADALGNVPLYYAEDWETIELLCEKGAEVNMRNKYGDTPLHKAVYDVNYDQTRIEELLEHGANPNIANKRGDTPLSIVQKMIAGDRIVNGNGEPIKITDGAKERLKKVLELLEKKVNPFHCAVANGNMEEVRMLLFQGAKLNEVDRFSNTALHYAKTPKMIRQLCAAGANVDILNKYDDTPLHVAVYDAAINSEYDQECIKILLDYFAKPNMENKRGDTPLSIVQKMIAGDRIVNGNGEPIEVVDGAKERLKEILKLLEEKVNLLRCAVANNNVDEVLVLLFQGAKLNEIDRHNNTALHYAKNSEIIDILCNVGADVNAQNEYGDTPLHNAVFTIVCRPHTMWMGIKAGDTNLHLHTMLRGIKALLDRGADPNIASKRNKTPSQMVDDAIRERKIDNGSGESFKVNDQAYAVYKEIEKLFKQFPLHEAMRYSDKTMIWKLFDKGYDPNIADTLGNVPLHYANTSERVKLLCENGAEANMRNRYGDTPLHIALYRFVDKFVENSENDQKCIKALLECGANPNMENKRGDTPLSIVQKVIAGDQIVNGNGEPIQVVNGAKERLKEILKLFMEKANLLHCAVANGNVKEVKRLLISERVNPNVVDGFGNTALHYARDLKIITLLCVAGADVNAQDKNGDSPLHILLYRIIGGLEDSSDLQCVKVLLKSGTDPNIANARGDTPLSIAQKIIEGGRIYDSNGDPIRISSSAKAALQEILSLLPHCIQSKNEAIPAHRAAVTSDKVPHPTSIRKKDKARIPTRKKSKVSSVRGAALNSHLASSRTPASSVRGATLNSHLASSRTPASSVRDATLNSHLASSRTPASSVRDAVVDKNKLSVRQSSDNGVNSNRTNNRSTPSRGMVFGKTLVDKITDKGNSTRQKTSHVLRKSPATGFRRRSVWLTRSRQRELSARRRTLNNSAEINRL
ncbi:MAG: ankyrin repeat domain-containing protein [Puniceicoccales bacterium]|jgi:ankyrin repeat protein|nr:ankyrin repeat domain-containing protein [Puniceicoccales bacterium]